MSIKELLRFPDPVNDVSARLTAGGVVLMAVACIAFQQAWLLPVLACGFLARVLTGPKLSPLGLIVTRAITPRLPLAPRHVPGPPKRFAQGIGAAVSVAACVLYFGLGLSIVSYGLVGMLALFAFLEAGFGFCMGCKTFALLIRAGLIPEAACRACADISLRRPSAVHV